MSNKTFIVSDSLQNEVSGSLSYDPNTNTATFQADTALTANSAYSVRITVGVTDAAGNAMASDFAWSFQTSDSGTGEAPTITSVSPLDGSSNVPVNSAISATFSEPMDPATLIG